jgi:hypothetical protein
MKEIPLEILDRALDWERSRAIADLAGAGPGARLFTCEALVPLLAAAMYRLIGGPLLLAVAREAGALTSDVDRFVPGEAHHLPGSGPGGDWLRPYDEAAGQRLKAARALEEGKLVVIGVEALAGGLPAPLSKPWPLNISTGGELDLEATLRLLVDGGYQREYTVEGWGRFAVRGGILDIFPSTADRPVRIELVGDRVESLREFNVVSQRSSDPIETVEVFPAGDVGQSEEYATPGGRQPLVLAVNPDVLEARVTEFTTEAGLARPVGPVLERWGRVLSASTIGGEAKGTLRFGGTAAREFHGDLTAAAEAWDSLSVEGTDVFLLLDGKGQVARASELWGESPRAGREPRAQPRPLHLRRRPGKTGAAQARTARLERYARLLLRGA